MYDKLNQTPVPLADRLDEPDDVESLDRRTGRGSSCWRRVATIAAFLAGCIISGRIGALLALRSEDNYDEVCASHTSRYSPILNEVQIKYRPTLFNGSLWDEGVYRRPAGPEVDASWDALGINYTVAVISYEDGIKSGFSDAYVQRSEKYGGGFTVGVEVLHHLHCLNLVRKALYYNHEYYRKLGINEFLDPEYVLRGHVDHCVDYIRQVLMCNADTGVVGFRWMHPDNPGTMPIFRTLHTCKNFDAIRSWAEAARTPPREELPDDFLKDPVLEEILPGPP